MAKFLVERELLLVVICLDPREEPRPAAGEQMVEYDPKIDIAKPKVGPEATPTAPFAVRETYRLYRLRAARAVAVVAADMDDEARALAARHDLQGRDWHSPVFASAEVEETTEKHVLGDVVISSAPGELQPSNRK